MILFFYGPNTYAARLEIRKLSQAYVEKTGSDFGLERLDGSGANLKALQSILQTVPFLATSRLIVVEGFGQSKPAAAALEALLAAVNETTVVIFYDPEADQRTAYFKTMKELARVVKFESLGQADLIAWMAKEAKRHGGSIGRPASLALLEAAGEDQWRLSGELLKLVSYQEEVTPETIKLLVVPNVNQSIFDLTEAMTAGRGRAALTLYRSLLAERVNEHYILTMVTWQLRNLLLAKSAGGVTPAELAKAAGLSPYAAGKAITAAKAYDEPTLKQAVMAAADCEWRIKTGQEPSDRAVERLILAVAATAR